MGSLYQVDGATGQARIIIQNGVTNPVSGTLGELHYRSDEDQLQIYDGTLFKAVLGGSYRVYREKVNETPNGAITAFTVDNPYVNTTTEVYLNGVLQEITTDYTETNPATGTITFTVAPLTGAIITVSYSRLEGSSLPLFNKFSVTVGTPVSTYSGSTTVFDLPFAYTPGAGNLLVWSSGVLMLVGATEDYQETDLNTITFNTARTGGEIIQFIKIGAANDEGTSGWADSGTVVALRTATDQVQIGDGSPSLPALSFISDPDTGFYRNASNNITLSLNGAAAWRWESTANYPVVDNVSTIGSISNRPAAIYMGDGNTGNPSFTFGADTNTGIWRGASDDMRISTDGVTRLRIKNTSVDTEAAQHLFTDGSAGTPSLSFISDTDTGLFRVGSNQLGIAAGAVKSGQFNTTGETDGTQYIPFQLFGGTAFGGGIAQFQVTMRSTASVSTSPVEIFATEYGFLMVNGLTGGGASIFTDFILLHYGENATVLGSKNSNSPAARTYTLTGGDKLSLQMGSGTYSIHCTFFRCPIR
jgi:hypothetical protein